VRSLTIFRYAQKVAGIKQRVRGAKFQEHFNQAQLFINSLSDYEREHVISAFGFELAHCDDPVVYRTYTKILNNVDSDIAAQVAAKVDGEIPDQPGKKNQGGKSAALSQLHYAPKTPTIKSRRITILLADGFNFAEVEAVRAVLKSAMATTWIIGPSRAKIKSSTSGATIHADHHFEDQLSTMFDALYIPSGDESAKTLMKSGRTMHWVQEAFGHCKLIAAVGKGQSVDCMYTWPVLTFLQESTSSLLLWDPPLLRRRRSKFRAKVAQ